MISENIAIHQYDGINRHNWVIKEFSKIGRGKLFFQSPTHETIDAEVNIIKSVCLFLMLIAFSFRDTKQPAARK